MPRYRLELLRGRWCVVASDGTVFVCGTKGEAIDLLRCLTRLVGGSSHA